MEEMNFILPKHISVGIRWNTIVSSDQDGWPFLTGRTGKRISSGLLEKMKGPQIYRFYFNCIEGKPRCYIGESEVFEDRCRKYISKFRKLNKSKPLKDSAREDLERAWKELQTYPEVRVGAMIQNSEVEGTRVELQLIDFDEFGFNNVLISQENLSNPFQRMAIENLAVLDSEASGINIMNSGRDVNAKWFSNFLKKNAEKRNATQK
jgi:hypothetical protein